MNMSRASLFVLIPAFLLSCDEGIAPPSAAPGSVQTGSFSGTVHFTSWSMADTVYDLRVVAFTVFPPADVIDEVLAGRAVVFPPLGAGALTTAGSDSVSYRIALSPGTYPYVAVAQQFGPDLFADWKPVGQYDLDTNDTQPSPVTVTAGADLSGIDILVDFANPPPIP